MIPRWFLYSAAAGFCWAVWAILSKVLDRAHPTLMQVQVLFTAGLLPPAAIALVRARREIAGQPTRGGWYALLSGLLGALGNLAFYSALARGGLAAVVVPLTSLYPLITVAVAWALMGERIGRVQLAGAVAAVVAVVLLSGEASALAGAGSLGAGAVRWVGYAGAALVAWGLLSAAQKASTATVSPDLSFAAFSLAFIPVAVVGLLTRPASWHLPPRTIALGVAAGAMNGLGMLASFAAYRADGEASIVTPLAGVLTSLFTVGMALALLGESLDRAAVVGVAVAVVAAAALSWEPRAAR